MMITPDQYSNELTAESCIRHLAIDKADAIRESGRHGGELAERQANRQANEIRDEACAEYTRRAQYLGSIL